MLLKTRVKHGFLLLDRSLDVVITTHLGNALATVGHHVSRSVAVEADHLWSSTGRRWKELRPTVRAGWLVLGLRPRRRRSSGLGLDDCDWDL